MFDGKHVSISLLILLFFHFAGLSILAEPQKSETIEVKASDTAQLKQMLEDQKVEATLVDRTHLKGRIKEVRDGSVIIKVERSQGPSVLTRGEHSVPATRLSTLRIIKIKGKKRAILATSLGLVGLFLGYGLVASRDEQAGAGTKAATVIAPVAGAIVGYFLGKQSDKKGITIVIR